MNFNSGQAACMQTHRFNLTTLATGFLHSRFIAKKLIIYHLFSQTFYFKGSENRKTTRLTNDRFSQVTLNSSFIVGKLLNTATKHI